MEGTSLTASFASAGLAVFLFFVALYVVALVRRDNSVADIGWGIGFIIAVLAALWQNDTLTMRQVLVTVLVSIWGVRLSTYIWLRRRGGGEERRYAQWRRQWGEHWVIRSFLQVFLLQAMFLIVTASPVIYVAAMGGPSLGILDLAGVLLWTAGFIWEVVADYQLVIFTQRRSGHGHVFRSGLWRFSRHPNYFGEITMWWGLWLIALSVPGSWLTVVGPLFITYLLVRVSGVAMLEKRYWANPEYLAYQRSTSMLVPRVPRK